MTVSSATSTMTTVAETCAASAALTSSQNSNCPTIQIGLKTAALTTARIKASFLLLTFVGVTNLWLAVLADMGTSLLVTANALLLMTSPKTADRWQEK
jgi:cation transport ATPase